MKSVYLAVCFLIIGFAEIVYADEPVVNVPSQESSSKSTIFDRGTSEVQVGSATPGFKQELGTQVGGLTSWPVIFFTLFGIVALIFLLGWGARRMGGMSAMGIRSMKVLAAMPVGAREKVALIDVSGQQFLIGVTSQNINHLHTFDKPVIEQGDVKQSDFSTKLQALLKASTARSEESVNKGEDETRSGTKGINDA